MLKSQAIQLVEAEVGMNHHNKLHVPLQRVMKRLARFDYALYYMHQMSPEVQGTGFIPVMRRCNAIFISRKAAVENYRDHYRPLS